MRNTFQSNHPLSFRKIVFNLKRTVKFGEAVYVCGNIPELGNWRPESSLKLKWKEGDLWTGVLLFTSNIPRDFEFKYVVSDFNAPSCHQCEWQIGQHNRRLDLTTLKKLIITEDRWNMDKINLNLYLSQQGASQSQERYYVVGDLPELGSWKEPKIMKHIRERSKSHKKDSSSHLSKFGQEKNQIYSFSFYTFRLLSEFRYYYIKKGEIVQSQRKPGRIFHFENQKEAHPQRRGVTHFRGEISIHDNCRLNVLKFSRITPQMYVGSYPRSNADLQMLKDHNITAIFSIQSERDFKSHGISPHYFKLLCQDYGIKFKRYAIEDMNNEDFVERAQGGIRILNELIKEGMKVYIHCSAGIYRSPQMIALYLAVCDHYTVEQAISIVTSNHPFARPSSKVIKDAMSTMRLKRMKSRVCA